MAGRRFHHPRAAGNATIGIVGTVAVHALVVAFIFFTVKTPPNFPPVYSVNLVAAPEPRPETKRAPEAVERPAAEAAVPIKPAPVKPKDVPKPTPARPTPTPEQREPAPRTQSTQAPARGETPSTGNDVANIKTNGLDFPFPDYLRNIVNQILRRWERPMAPTSLRAEVSFFILKDGTVRDLRFVTPSGNFTFDLSAQGAIEAAGNAKAFGPLPDGYEADVLPVSFFFAPRGNP
jgi:protein TonB